MDDGRAFWKHIVTSSTGCSDAQYFEELYQYFMTEKVKIIFSQQTEIILNIVFVVSDVNQNNKKHFVLARLGSFVILMLKMYLKL